mgnify:CR=1 FL=1|jgi:hypothetical protein
MKIHKKIIQQTPEWFELKKGKISWTSLKWVVWWDKAQLTQMYELIAQEYIEEEDLNAWEIMDRWNQLEDIAKLFFQDITWKEVEEVWFIEKDDQHGLSPDGIIKNWELYTEALEIKCPRWKNYVKYYIENKIPDEYKNQVINYFIVMDDLEKLYFMIYSNDTINWLPTYKIIEITREQLATEITKAEVKITKFKTEWDNLKNKLWL